ncbi:hypothetical protein ACFO6U_08935 [Enterococcus canintestini]|nr:hypothetical protein [Enterococcus canintestini]
MLLIILGLLEYKNRRKENE